MDGGNDLSARGPTVEFVCVRVRVYVRVYVRVCACVCMCVHAWVCDDYILLL